MENNDWFDGNAPEVHEKYDKDSWWKEDSRQGYPKQNKVSIDFKCSCGKAYTIVEN